MPVGFRNNKTRLCKNGIVFKYYNKMWLLSRAWCYCLLIMLTVDIGCSEVLTENFIIRLKDMEKIIEDQRAVIANLTKVIEEASLKNIVSEQQNLIQNCSNSLVDVKGNLATMDDKHQMIQNKVDALAGKTALLETGNILLKKTTTFQ